VVTGFEPRTIYRGQPTKFSMSGTGLGGWMSIKLSDSPCQGSGESTADSDVYGVPAASAGAGGGRGMAGGVVVQVSTHQVFEVLDDDAFADTVFGTVASATLVISQGTEATVPEGAPLNLCIKYANVTVPGVASSGYHYLGSVTLLEPSVSGLSSQGLVLFSGRSNGVTFTGQGLQTLIPSFSKLVPAYAQCAGGDADHVIAGGAAQPPISGTSSQSLSFVFDLPVGVEQGAVTVCFRFSGRSTWQAMGSVSVLRAAVTLASPSTGSPLYFGEPFNVTLSVASGGRLGGRDSVKVVGGASTCSGTDHISDALPGGHGRHADPLSASLLFPEGVLPSIYGAGAADQTHARLCIFAHGTSGYTVLSPSLHPLLPPFASSLSPLAAAANTRAVFTLAGRGLATRHAPHGYRFVWFNAPGSCAAGPPDGARGVQMSSLDGSRGRLAVFHWNFDQPGSFQLCWMAGGSGGGAAVVPGATVIIHDRIQVASLWPLKAPLGVPARMLVTGAGLSVGISARLVASSPDGCDASVPDFPGGGWGDVSPIDMGGSSAYTPIWNATMQGDAFVCFKEASSGNTSMVQDAGGSAVILSVVEVSNTKVLKADGGYTAGGLAGYSHLGPSDSPRNTR
jgi:hypothetical protein